MRRRLLTTLSVLSLALCVGTVALWVRSYWIEESIEDAGRAGLWEFDVSKGVFHFYWERLTNAALAYEEDTMLNPFGLRRESTPPREHLFEREGKRCYDLRLGDIRVAFDDRSARAWPIKVTVAYCPCWLVAALLFIIPAQSAIVRYRRGRNLRAGLCPRCGYDLRATPDRCPECGRRVAEADAQ